MLCKFVLTRHKRSDVNKARTLKAKAKAKAIPVGNEAGTVPSRTDMGDHGK